MKNNAWVLTGAVVCGLAAMALALVYLQQQSAAYGPEATAAVLVADRDLPAGTRLEPDRDLTTLEVPARLERLVALAADPVNVATLRGRELNRPVAQGSPIMYGDLVPLVDLELNEDELALAIPTNPTAAVGGLLAPGDHVKLFVTRPVHDEPAAGSLDTEAAPEQMLTQALMQGMAMQHAGSWQTQLIIPEPLQILAVGQRMRGTRQQLGTLTGQDQAGGGFSSVTLRVTEQQARHILEQTGGGQQTVTLVLTPKPAHSARDGEF